MAAAVALSACATAKPEVKVIAMSQAKAGEKSPEVVVYMEVVNPTARELSLSRLDYRLSADSWFESKGTVDLRRAVAARSSTVVEVAVPIGELQGESATGVPYKLRGRLFAQAEDRVERSWRVDATGKLRTQAATIRVNSGSRVGSSE